MMKLKKILAIVSAMTCMFAVTSPAYAYSDCAVTVKMAHTADEPVHKTEPVSGASVTLSKVATLEADGTYKSLDKFSDVLKTFDVTTAAENIALSKKLADVADTGITKTTGKSGTAIFNGLSKGVYLVQETGRTGEASYYSLAEPYLIAVPYDLKGYAQNTVVTAPKIVPLTDLDNGDGNGDNGDRNKDKDKDKDQDKNKDKNKDQNKDKQKKQDKNKDKDKDKDKKKKKKEDKRKDTDNPITGDTSVIMPYAVALAVSVAVIVVVMRRKKKEK